MTKRTSTSRKAPETAAEHEEEARRRLMLATHPGMADFWGAEHAARHMRLARVHAEAAHILHKLEELHR